MSHQINRDGSVRQSHGGGSRWPVRRVIRRMAVHGDQRGELHLTLCEHGSDNRSPRVYLHLHTFVRLSKDVRKPVAFNAHQLGRLIAELQRVQAEMEAGTGADPAAREHDAAEPPRRVRGRRADRQDPPSPGGDDAEP